MRFVIILIKSYVCIYGILLYNNVQPCHTNGFALLLDALDVTTHCAITNVVYKK